MSVQGIDFSHLTLCEGLDLAILIEAEAQERYEEFAHQMEIHHTTEAAMFFRFMAVNESKHGEQLLQRRTTLFGDAPRTITRSMLWDVEAPEYDEARALMSARQAMEAALRSEEKAHAFFERALPEVRDAETKKLFAELCEEEVVHEKLVKAEIAKLPPDPPISGDDFEDEPNAQ